MLAFSFPGAEPAASILAGWRARPGLGAVPGSHGHPGHLEPHLAALSAVVTCALSDLTRRVLPAEKCLEGEGGALAGALLGEGGAALLGDALLGEGGALFGDGGALLGDGGALLGVDGSLVASGVALAWLPPVVSVGSVGAFSLLNSLVLLSAESLRFTESVELLRLVDSVESLLLENGSFFTTASSSPG